MQNTLVKNGNRILALSINSTENGYAIFDGDSLIECGELNIEYGKYYKTLRSIFFTCLKTMRNKGFDVVAIGLEGEDNHPGVFAKNMKIAGLIMGAAFLNGKIKFIEITRESAVKACGLSVTDEVSKESIISIMSEFSGVEIKDFKTAEAVAIGIAANLQIKLSDGKRY